MNMIALHGKLHEAEAETLACRAQSGADLAENARAAQAR
jgi:hypothetical protein